MTPTVNEATLRFLESGAYESLSRNVDVIATLLLIGLLVEAELLQAHAGWRARIAVRALLAVSLPLLVAFVVVVVARAGGAR
jgi:uncharacterized membrane protein